MVVSLPKFSLTKFAFECRAEVIHQLLLPNIWLAYIAKILPLQYFATYITYLYILSQKHTSYELLAVATIWLKAIFVCLVLKIALSVTFILCVCVSVCACVSTPRALITSDMIWCDVDPMWLVKLYINLPLIKWMGITQCIMNAWERRQS